MYTVDVELLDDQVESIETMNEQSEPSTTPLSPISTQHTLPLPSTATEPFPENEPDLEL